MPFAVVILAAGQSQRMGRPKLILPWAGSTILGHLLKQWEQLGTAQIGVVCAANNPGIEGELARIGFSPGNCIVNSEPERGMFSSIQCAARWQQWNANLTHWAIVLGDQPQLPLELLRAVLQLSATHPERICQPRYDGHRRHPVLLPKGIFGQLATSNASDLKQFLNGYLSETLFLESSDPALALDVDTPEDYQIALGRYGGC